MSYTNLDEPTRQLIIQYVYKRLIEIYRKANQNRRKLVKMNRETVDLTDLWQQYKLNNDLAAREKLIEQYIPLVQYIAGRIAIHLPDNVEFND